MRKKFLFGSFTLLATIMIIGLADQPSISYTSGSPEGKTGSPGDGETCATGGCHLSNPGTPTENEVIELTSNIPVTGYLAGMTYDLTATMTDSAIEKFGFQISPQNVAGDILGTLIAGPETGVVGMGGYVTHNFLNTDGPGTRSWDFQWTAPAAGTGDVTFYGAFNFSNDNNQANGDVILVMDTTVTEDPAIGVTETEKQIVSVYPNPANEFITVKGNFGNSAFYKLIDLAGKVVLFGRLGSTGVIDLQREKNVGGLYVLQVEDGIGLYTQRVLLN